MKTIEKVADAYLSICASTVTCKIAQMLPTDNREIKQIVKDSYPLSVPFLGVCVNITCAHFLK